MKMAVESMEMAPGAIPRPGRVPEQRLLSPESCFGIDGGVGTFCGLMPIELGFLRQEAGCRNRDFCPPKLVLDDGGDGDGGVDGDGSGGNSPSRQGAGTETSVPRNLFWMTAELGVVFCEILWGLGFSPRGQFMVQRAASGGARGSHTTLRAA